MLIGDLLRRRATSDHPAVIEGARTVTYRQLHDDAQALAHLLRSDGGPGPVALTLPNGIDFVTAYFAAALAGRVVVPFHEAAGTAEIGAVLTYAGATTLVTDLRHRPELPALLAALPQTTHLLDVGAGSGRAPQALSGTARRPVERPELRAAGPFPGPDDIAVLLHTSGTSSEPKRVMLTHRNVVGNARTHRQLMGFDASSRSLLCLPMAFSSSHTAQLLAHLDAGGTLVVHPGPFLPSAVCRSIETHGITDLALVPTNLLMLSRYRRLERRGLGSLRDVVVSGGPLAEVVLHQVATSLPRVGFVLAYGLTEAGPRVSQLMHAERQAPNTLSSGPPLPEVQVRVVDEADRDVAPGLRGELLVRGPGVMKGYLARPEQTGRALRHGWLHTGDLGHLGADGHVHVTGRRKNLILCGGVNLYPEEIEEVVGEHPDVAEALVCGEPHELLGEVPIAYVVPTHEGRLDAGEVAAHCGRRLGKHQMPYRFVTVATLPRTGNGKLVRGTPPEKAARASHR